MLGRLCVIQLNTDKKFVINNLVGLVGLVGVKNYRHTLLILVQFLHINFGSELHDMSKIYLLFGISHKEGFRDKTGIFVENLRI